VAQDRSLASVAVPTTPSTARRPLGRPLVRLPAVYPPSEDSMLLADAVAAEPLAGARVLDLCTGSGVVAVSAMQAGAEDVVAVDVSRRAVLAARLNLWGGGGRTTVRRGDLFAVVPDGGYDLIVSNPPYVPSKHDDLPTRGAARAWDGGRDGRSVVDRICDEAPSRLRPGGRMLLVHSDVAAPERTVERLERAGLDVAVVARRDVPFGPVMTRRAERLREARLIAEGPPVEQLVVIRAALPAGRNGATR
jgi:release factor glutamine methyltransferase